jgi:hypothetical protein
MKRWFCMDCRKKVVMDKHGRCGHCDSEAIVLDGPETDLTGSFSCAKNRTDFVISAAKN